MQVKVNGSDCIAVFGSGSLTGNCVRLIRKYSKCKICVFEKKLSSISALEKQIGNIENVQYYTLSSNIEDILLALTPKIIFSIVNFYIFTDDVIDKYPIINYHNALLPHHPGRNAEAWTIFSQDAVAGITWHFVEKKVDAGDIIVQEEVPVQDTTTALQLLSQQAKVAYKVFDHILIDIFEKHSLEGCRQMPIENTEFHFSWDRPNNGLLDLSWDIKKMSAFLRSMDYGKLRMLGLPFLLHEDAAFVWDKYRIGASQGPKETRFDFEKKEALFVGDGLSIALLGLRPVGKHEEDEMLRNAYKKHERPCIQSSVLPTTRILMDNGTGKV